MAKQLTKDQIMEIKEAFRLFDRVGNNTIPTKDLGTAMRSLGQNPTKAEISALTKELDPKATGSIQFTDFLTMMSTKMNNVDNVEGLLEAFKIFDQEGNGYITTAQLRHVMTNLGEKLNNDEIDEMIREGDISGKGKINYVEFVTLMSKR